jgi:IS5 family transposase
MIGKIKKKAQLEIFKVLLSRLVNPNHELCILASEIDWAGIENDLSVYYSEHGRPSVPIRTMVGMLFLKNMYNLSDEGSVARWIENPYWQYFTGEQYFQNSQPFTPSEYVHFRKRIGQEGMEKIMSYTVKVHSGAINEKEVQIDSTVQPKNITFPTDSKLAKRIIDNCLDIANNEGTKVRQSYKRVVKQLMKEQYNSKHPSRAKKARKARKRLKIIAGRLIRELQRELGDELLHNTYDSVLSMYEQVLNQTRKSKNKIYSLHEPETACIAKGKAHKQYEFGSKVTIVRGSKTGVILGAYTVTDNPHDSKLLLPTLKQSKRILENIGGELPQVAITDRGYRGVKEVEGVSILIPTPGKRNQTKYQKQKARKRFRGRAGIEPVIGHIKHDHRMIKNYLKGTLGDIINAISAAMSFNLKKRLNQIAFCAYFQNQFDAYILSLRSTVNLLYSRLSQKMAF